MGRVVVTEFVSIDGVMEDPGGAEGYRHGGWTFKFNDPDGMKFKLEETLASTALLLGRVTYEGFAKAWPGMKDDVGFADQMNSIPKYVVTSTLDGDLDWSNSSVLNGELKPAVEALKAELDGDIVVHGSRTLVQGLLAEGLVDELRLMVFPIVLGSGKRLFADDGADATTLSLAGCRQLATGSVILTYRATA
jgi:dihydrofolate reductase